MYPANFFNLFPPFPSKNTVFIAISFNEHFERRLTEVIVPAVKSMGLEPIWVKVGKVSDSLLTEILNGIRECKLFLADVSTYYKQEDNIFRNANVMYEVGIAHSVRLPEEVLLFRSDEDRLIFDIANVRVNKYAPDTQPKEAMAIIKDAIKASLEETELWKSLLVQQICQALDFTTYRLLTNVVISHETAFNHPKIKNAGDLMRNTRTLDAIRTCLEWGIIKTQYRVWTPEMICEANDIPEEELLRYILTPLGAAVWNAIVEKHRLDSPEVKAACLKVFGPPPAQE
jgi:hypothetical protein